jgi:hypothetical protein
VAQTSLTSWLIRRGNCSEAYFPAVHHEEDMTIDKENIDANANLLLEL